MPHRAPGDRPEFPLTIEVRDGVVQISVRSAHHRCCDFDLYIVRSWQPVTLGMYVGRRAKLFGDEPSSDLAHQRGLEGDVQRFGCKGMQ
jgi:hypothetical protein